MDTQVCARRTSAPLNFSSSVSRMPTVLFRIPYTRNPLAVANTTTLNALRRKFGLIKTGLQESDIDEAAN